MTTPLQPASLDDGVALPSRWRDAILRVRGDPLLAALPLTALIGGLALIPITLTSDVWSDFSVTFLFWWAVGSSVTLARSASAAQSASPTPAAGSGGLADDVVGL